MKTKFRLIGIILALSIVTASMTACFGDFANKKEAVVPMKIAVLKGPTGMGIVKLMEKDSLADKKQYEFTVSGMPDEVAAQIISKEIDAAAVPTNLASVIYNKTKGQIAIVAVNTLGVLYVLDSTDTIKSFEDLRGKKVWVSGKGSVPEYAFNYLLEQNKIDSTKDIQIDYSLSHEELATAAASGDANIALLPQPHVTAALAKNPNLIIALDLTKEWNKLEGNSELAMGCFIVNKEFLENNSEKIEGFLSDYKNSVSWVNENKEEAGALIEKYGILANKNIATKAIPNSSIVFYEGSEAKDILKGFFEALYTINPKAIGGAMPDDEIYFSK